MNQKYKDIDQEFYDKEKQTSGCGVRVAVLTCALGLGIVWFAPRLYNKYGAKFKEKLIPNKELRMSNEVNITIDGDKTNDTTIFLGRDRWRGATYLRITTTPTEVIHTVTKTTKTR